LVSALAGLGIDNALVEVSAGEVPIMDAARAVCVSAAIGRHRGAKGSKRFIRILEKTAGR